MIKRVFRTRGAITFKYITAPSSVIRYVLSENEPAGAERGWFR